MSVVSINNADSSDSRSRLAIRPTNLGAVVRWKGSNLVSKTRSNLSVDLGYHVVDPVYLSSQIAKTAETEKHAKLRKQNRCPTKYVRQSIKFRPYVGSPSAEGPRGHRYGSTKRRTNRRTNLPPISISICIVPLDLKVFRLRIIKAK